MTDESIFAAALAIPSPAGRAAYLDRACAGNSALRQEVEGLLAAHAASNPLDRPARPVEYTGPYQPEGSETGPTAAVGDRVGPYKLLERIGEGGMGEVWVADQLDPIKRRVALKLIKPGMDTRSVLGRFEAERQALAVMDHPNISKVLDAGTTADGRPFFVMELVKGTPITQFCDARKLTPKQRLELFIPVCLAIQHAHQKGIIHRDIKPSNVLVELYDDKAVAKVIDFGVAKAIGQQLTEKTIYTGFGALVGTPAYMAPEQATFNALDVDTRADVYALGVLLYELLAGSPPVELERLKKAALDEVLRIVRDEEPPRPSQRLSTSQAKASIAATRQSDPVKLSQLMKGELDWIVMKALEKDRTRRYDSATALAKDVERYLTGDAVEACPPTLGYRLRKAYRRNRTAVRVAGAFVGMLLVAVGVSTWLAVKATRAEAVAEEKRIEAEANAERAQTNADRAAVNYGMFRGAMWAVDEERQSLEIKVANLQIDCDLSELRTDPRLGLLRLINTLATLPTRAEREIDGMKLQNSFIDQHRDLREFVTAVILTTGQYFAPLLPPITHDGHKLLANHISPDGKRILTLGADGTARIWDSRFGKQIAILCEGGERVINCGFSLDGKTIFTDDGNGSARFWEPADGKYRAQTKRRVGMSADAIDHPDKNGKIGGGGGFANYIPHSARMDIGQNRLLNLRVIDQVLAGPVELSDTNTGRLVARLDYPGKDIQPFHFSRDGQWITTIADQSTVVIFSAETGREVARLIHPTGEAVRHLEVSPSGQRIGTLSGNEMGRSIFRIWNITSWKMELNPMTIEDTISEFQFLSDSVFACATIVNVSGMVWSVFRYGQSTPLASWFPATHLPTEINNLLNFHGQIIDSRTGQRLVPPRGARYHPSLSLFAPDGRFAISYDNGTTNIIDTYIDKQFYEWRSNMWGKPARFSYLPKFGTISNYNQNWVGVSATIRLIPTAAHLSSPPDLLQLWTQVAVRGELGPEGEFVKWTEETWEKKRQELAAVPPPYPDFPFPGYVATDKLHWLRAEYEAAAEKDKLPLATELLRRAEASGDKTEAVRWRAERARFVREVAPLPRAKR